MTLKSSGQRVFRRIAAATIAVFVASGLLVGPPAAAQFPSRHVPKLVVLGDSYSSGVGNIPYIESSGDCKRSDAAYAKLLERFGVVRLEAFVACSGATTKEVTGGSPNHLIPQINSITPNTDVVALTALGNDFFVSILEGMCFSQDPKVNCDRDSVVPVPVGHPLYGKTVGDVVDSIPRLGPALMQDLIGNIKSKLVKPGARILLIEYPNIVGDGGPYCPTLSAQELPVAQQIAASLDSVIKAAAEQNHGVEFVAAARYFVGHDACSLANFIYPPIPRGYGPAASGDPQGQGALHPNQIGQGVYAATLAGKLYLR